MSEHHAPVEASARARIGTDAFRGGSSSGPLRQRSHKRCRPRLAIQTVSLAQQQATHLRQRLTDAKSRHRSSLAAGIPPTRNGS